MRHDTSPSPSPVLDTETALRDFLQHLLRRANIRQVWMFFLDREHRLVEPIMPMNDHPGFPDQLCETDDLGTVPFSRVFVHRSAYVLEMIGAASVVFVWERIGPPRPGALDLKWVRAIAGEASRQGLPVRAQFLLHSGGLRPFSEAEVAPVEEDRAA